MRACTILPLKRACSGSVGSAKVGEPWEVPRQALAGASTFRSGGWAPSRRPSLIRTSRCSSPTDSDRAVEAAPARRAATSGFSKNPHEIRALPKDDQIDPTLSASTISGLAALWSTPGHVPRQGGAQGQGRPAPAQRRRQRLEVEPLEQRVEPLLVAGRRALPRPLSRAQSPLASSVTSLHFTSKACLLLLGLCN